MSSLLTHDELERYSMKFICFLYQTTLGDLNKSHKTMDVFFRAVSTGAYERPSYGFQAVNEIIRKLKTEGLVEVVSASEVRLTSSRPREVQKRL